MGKYPVYAIMALVFLGIIKLLQVTAFDAEQYAKNKKSSFSNAYDKIESAIEKKSKNSKKEKQEESVKEMPALFEKSTNNVEKVADTDVDKESSSAEEKTIETEGSSFETSQPSETSVSYESYADLKNLYLAPKIASLPSGQLREDVVIRYYRHKKDGDKVFSLKELGYYIHEKEATETAGLGSNVLYYGEDVNVEDIQIVSYALLEVGIPLKAILQTQFIWKANSLEIGTDTLLLDGETLSELEIKNFEK